MTRKLLAALAAAALASTAYTYYEGPPLPRYDRGAGFRLCADFYSDPKPDYLIPNANGKVNVSSVTGKVGENVHYYEGVVNYCAGWKRDNKMTAAIREAWEMAHDALWNTCLIAEHLGILGQTVGCDH